MHLENDSIVFTAKFSGQTVQVMVHPLAVMAIYASENGRGMEFGPEYNIDYPAPDELEAMQETPVSAVGKSKKPFLKLVEKDE